jgi:hypothetical protein
MKALKIVILVISVSVIVAVLGLYIIWLGYPKKEIDLFILDKTVKDMEYSKHRSLTWLLNNSRFIHKNGDNYSVSDDYYGFMPQDNKQYEIKRISLEQIDSLSNSYDALYYADTYGVYFNEWFRGFKKGQGGENSVIEGGINQNDYLLLKNMKDKKKLIIGEYNILSSPTSELLRFKTEEIFGITSTGWTGAYFESLDSVSEMVPTWIIDIYKNQYNNDWAFKNAGIILINGSNVLVLEMNKQLNFEKPVISITNKLTEKYNLPMTINYINWFEVISSSDTCDVLANFQINATESGDSLLRANNIPVSFPAIVAYTKNANNSYYFAGDFACNPVHTLFSRLANSRKIMTKIKKDDANMFFQNFYFPLMEGILTDYTKTLKK